MMDSGFEISESPLEAKTRRLLEIEIEKKLLLSDYQRKRDALIGRGLADYEVLIHIYCFFLAYP
jgi:hypothetical protein